MVHIVRAGIIVLIIWYSHSHETQSIKGKLFIKVNDNNCLNGTWNESNVEIYLRNYVIHFLKF